nr:hypothetical protein BaRGS_008628 [Batillaria attramentaria]KAG5709802.1 hypothetical protein BaRGS_032626 [Batillaria attramentaria]
MLALQAIFCWSTPVSPFLITHNCFQELCRCNRFTLDCSSNFGSLTYVPSVMDNVKVLNFSNNKLTILPDKFFVNVSKTVWLLDLYNNGLEHISDKAFEGMAKLDTVLIGGNILNYTSLAPVFAIPTLEKLDIKCGNLGPIPKERQWCSSQVMGGIHGELESWGNFYYA